MTTSSSLRIPAPGPISEPWVPSTAKGHWSDFPFSFNPSQSSGLVARVIRVASYINVGCLSLFSKSMVFCALESNQISPIPATLSDASF
jgi:hypothetical protein